MTEEQQEPVIKITDYYFTDAEVIWALKNYYCFRANNIQKDDIGFYWREETEI